MSNEWDEDSRSPDAAVLAFARGMFGGIESKPPAKTAAANTAAANTAAATS